MRRLTWLIAAACVGLSVLPGRAQNPPAPETQEQPAEPAAPAVDPRFESPAATMQTFLDAMNARGRAESRADRDRATSDAVACLELSGAVTGAGLGQDYAVQLYQFLNKLGLIRSAALLHSPGTDDPTRAVVFPNFSIIEARGANRRSARSAYDLVVSYVPDGAKIELVRTGTGEWKFPATSLERLPDLLDSTERLPDLVEGDVTPTLSQRVRGMVPRSLRGNRVFGLEPWQWIGLLVVIGVGLVLDTIVRTVLGTIWRRVMRRREREPDSDLLKRAVRPFGLLVAAVLWFFALRLLGLPPGALVVLLAAVRVFLMLAAVWAAYRVTDLGCEYLGGMADRTETKFDDLLVPLVRKTIKVFVTAAGVIYIANAFDIEILPLLTGLGIGGLAFAFAAKDTIENFFGSVAVILDRPFEVGDWVVIDDVEGTVESLGIRSTRIRTFYNSLVSVPNATLVRARVDNYGRRRFRRFKTHVGVTYDTPPEKIEAFCSGIREIIRLHPYTRKDYYHVWLNGWGASSLDVLVYMFHECPDWATELRERHRFMLDVMRLADRLGVSFAFPTQTLHLYQEEHGVEHTPADAPGTEGEARAQGEGHAAARAVTADQPWRRERPGAVSFAAPSQDLEAGMDEAES